jgi:hypothetical protein
VGGRGLLDGAGPVVGGGEWNGDLVRSRCGSVSVWAVGPAAVATDDLGKAFDFLTGD